MRIRAAASTCWAFCATSERPALVLSYAFQWWKLNGALMLAIILDEFVLEGLNPLISTFLPECGAGFTQKLEGMFRDMELSKDLGGAFRNVCFLTFIALY